MEMKTGDRVKVNPALTGLEKWIESTVIDVEKNPFRGIIVSSKDAAGRIFFGEIQYFELLNNNVCLQ